MTELFSEKKKCFGCGSCSAVCPMKAITMQRDEEGFFYPSINNERCIDCGACQSICPEKHLLKQVGSKFFALRCDDMELLYNSTSGGAFSLLAQEVIGQGGLVCGVCFDEKFHVAHMLSEEIGSMRKSKYVQSDMQSVFLQVKNALKNGKHILFTGTPCQCHAMKLYCSEYQDQLVIAALICRGVLSPGLWEDYVSWLSCDAPLEKYDFRDKRQPNDAHTLAYTAGGIETAVPWGQDGFCRIYGRGLAYRPSCYSCPYCSPDNDFDFVLGDFWGIEKVYPELADGKGTSLVISHGKRAESLLEKIAVKAHVVPCDRVYAMQPALEAPAKAHFLRKFLFKDFANKNKEGHCDISLILKKYSKV